MKAAFNLIQLEIPDLDQIPVSVETILSCLA